MRNKNYFEYFFISLQRTVLVKLVLETKLFLTSHLGLQRMENMTRYGNVETLH